MLSLVPSAVHGVASWRASQVLPSMPSRQCLVSRMRRWARRARAKVKAKRRRSRNATMPAVGNCVERAAACPTCLGNAATTQRVVMGTSSAVPRGVAALGIGFAARPADARYLYPATPTSARTTPEPECHSPLGWFGHDPRLLTGLGIRRRLIAGSLSSLRTKSPAPHHLRRQPRRQ